MLEDAKEVIISGISKKARQCTGQKFENTNGEIRNRKSRKDRQHKAKTNTKMVIRSVNQRT
jgi:hypothetical protein